MKRLSFALLFLLIFLLLLVFAGWWRSSGVGPQVQVPMFYDAHYLFPRPWTQEQEAPGVPAPASVSALYGPNRITQSFVAGSDRLSLVELWLAGKAETPVHAVIAAPGGLLYEGEWLIDDPGGRAYALAFPEPQLSAGKRYTLTLSAPTATQEQPVTVRTVGGDRLGAAIRLNEYSRPGNLELFTFARGGWPGEWWLDAVGEQLLPAIFRLRVQQYKPDALKGEAFAGLLLVMLALTTIYLVLARPGGQKTLTAVGWALILILAVFQVWQLVSGRVRLPILTQPVAMRLAEEGASLSRPAEEDTRLVHDLALTMWTAQRMPEERFISTELVQGSAPGEAWGAIRAPADSVISHALIIPPASILLLGAEAVGEGAVGIKVLFNDSELAAQELRGADGITRLDLSLDAFAGQVGFLTLAAEPIVGEPDVRWLQPQIAADHGAWLPAELPAEAVLLNYRLGGHVSLLGFTLDPPQPEPGESVTLTLFWQTGVSTAAQPKVFVHLRDGSGQMLAQHDAQPVLNTYPLSSWSPGRIVADSHPLIWPEGSPADLSLTVGLYDPNTSVRWPVTDGDGVRQADDAAVLPFTGSGSGGDTRAISRIVAEGRAVR